MESKNALGKRAAIEGTRELSDGDDSSLSLFDFNSGLRGNPRRSFEAASLVGKLRLMRKRGGVGRRRIGSPQPAVSPVGLLFKSAGRICTARMLWKQCGLKQ
jgi:hypothetical protein